MPAKFGQRGSAKKVFIFHIAVIDQAAFDSGCAYRLFGDSVNSFRFFVTVVLLSFSAGVTIA